VKPEILDSCLPARLTNPTSVKKFAVLAIANYVTVFLLILVITGVV
jgi:hypothetical protein